MDDAWVAWVPSRELTQPRIEALLQDFPTLMVLVRVNKADVE